MKIENEKIIQATEDELYSYWLSRGWDDVYSFPEYMQRMKDAGCEVIAEIPPPTLFDRITQSPEVLAAELVYCEEPEHFCESADWRSVILGNVSYATKPEALAATVAKLKEVCVEQNAVDDTQPGLCSNDHAQKEVAELKEVDG